MRPLWPIYLLLFSSLIASAQSLELANSINLPAERSSVVIDQFGKIYLIEGGDLTKLNSQLENQGSFSDPAWGQISHLSVLNPMNPLLFYRDYGQVRILDNRLNESQSFNLFDLGLIDPTLVGQSDEESIWVFDQSLNQLLRVDLRSLKILNRSLNLSQILPDSVKYVALACGFNRNVLRSESGHYLVFDAFGSLDQTLLRKGNPVSFTLSANQILALYPTGLLEIIPLSGGKVQKILLPERQSLQEVYAWGDHIYIWAGAKLYHYLLN